MGDFQIYDAEENIAPSWPSKVVFVTLCALPMFATLIYGGADPIILGVFSVVTAIIIVLWIMDAWSLGELRFSMSPLQLPIIGLILIGIVQLLPLGDPGLGRDVLSIAPSTAISVDPYATRLFVIRLLAYLIFLAAALTFIDSQGRAKRAAIAIVIFGSLLAFVGILQRMTSPDAIYWFRPTPKSIAFGPFVNQHHFAAFMEMTSGLTFGFLFGGGLKRDRRPFLMIAAVLMGAALVFTGSRGGVISYAGVIAFAVTAGYLLGKRSHTNGGPEASRTGRFAMLAGTVALGLIVAGLVLYLGGGESLLRGIGLSLGDTDISTGRIQFWTIALKIFAANPILGSGLDAFGVAYTLYDPQSGLFRVEQAHNDYLQSLSDGGLLGFACVAAFVILLFRNGIRTIRATSDDLGKSIALGSLAGCFGVAIHSFFDFPLRTPSNALFFLLLVVLATTTYRTAKTPDRSRN